MVTMRRSLKAFLIGVLLVWLVPLVLALVAGAPGLGALIRFIQTADLPRAPLYFLLTTLLPALALSLGAGLAMFRVLGGGKVELLVAASAPWILWAAYVYSDVCLGAPVSCLSMYELSGLIVVPLGLLLAALIWKPPSPDTTQENP